MKDLEQTADKEWKVVGEQREEREEKMRKRLAGGIIDSEEALRLLREGELGK